MADRDTRALHVVSIILQVGRQAQAAWVTAAIVLSLQAGHAGDTDIGISAAEAVVATAIPMAGELHADTSIGDAVEAVAGTASCTSQESSHANTSEAADKILTVDGLGKAPSAANSGAHHMRAVNQSQAVKTHENGGIEILAVVQSLVVELRMLLRL